VVYPAAKRRQWRQARRQWNGSRLGLGGVFFEGFAVGFWEAGDAGGVSVLTNMKAVGRVF
jgi:hypothetical protein